MNLDPTNLPILQGINIHKKINNKDILKNIQVQINPAEMVSIVGPSGAGKSTLLHILSTLDTCSSGEIYFKKTRLNTLKTVELSHFRNKHIGFIFQFHHLLPEFTSAENILIPALIAGKQKQHALKRVAYLLDILGIKDKYDSKPNEMSGGEQQRVSIARALINEPAIIFADEPTGNLDTANAASIEQIFLSLNKEFKQSFVIVTHNMQLASKCTRIIEMKDGKIM